MERHRLTQVGINTKIEEKGSTHLLSHPLGAVEADGFVDSGQGPCEANLSLVFQNSEVCN